MDKEIISEIIEQFGGLTRMAEATGLGITTIHQWRARGNIPEWRHDAIMRAAKKKKIILSPDIFGKSPKETA